MKMEIVNKIGIEYKVQIKHVLGGCQKDIVILSSLFTLDIELHVPLLPMSTFKFVGVIPFCTFRQGNVKLFRREI